MKELGEYLKKAREARNISLKDIQETTKIRLTYLEAIEHGDFSVLPGEVYCKGFLASYATALGLDPQDILKHYHQLKTNHENPPLVGSQPNAPVCQTSKPTEPDVKTKKGLGPLAIGVGILVGLLAVGLIFGKTIPWYRGASKTTVSTKTKVKKQIRKTYVKPVQSDRPVESIEPVQTDQPTPTVEPASTEMVTKQIFPAPVTIYASFTEPVWVRIAKDGELLEDGRTFMPSDAQQLWTARQEINLTIGNAAGIKLQVNGKEQGVMGAHNQVLKLKITPDGNISKVSVSQ